MKLISDLLSLKNAIVALNRMDNDVGFALKEIDQLTTAICKIEEDVNLLPSILQQLSDNNSHLISKITALESELIAKELITKDYQKKVMN